MKNNNLYMGFHPDILESLIIDFHKALKTNPNNKWVRDEMRRLKLIIFKYEYTTLYRYETLMNEVLDSGSSENNEKDKK